MARQMMIRCASCGNQFGVNVEQIVDAGRDPDSKLRLLSGALNAAQCPNCGYQMSVGVPVLFHDAAKELLIGFVPLDLNLNNDQQEKILGDLLRDLTQRIPQNEFKGYLLQPRRALSMQHLVEQILQADGITPAMIEEQKVRARLIERLMEASATSLPALVAENDAAIDESFFQTMTLMAQRLAAGGATDMAMQIMEVQGQVAALSSFGRETVARARAQEQVMEEVADVVGELGEDADRPEFLALAREYQHDALRLRALVTLARPIFDAEFFQEMAIEIGAAPAEERAGLEALSETLSALAQQADAETQAALRQAVQLLQHLVNSPDMDAAVREAMGMIDSTFMQVLEANLQQAQRMGDDRLLERLAEVYNRVNAVIEQSMPTALRFLNQLLATKTDEEALEMLAAYGRNNVEELLQTMDAVERVLAQQGETALLSKLVFLRARAEALMG